MNKIALIIVALLAVSLLNVSAQTSQTDSQQKESSSGKSLTKMAVIKSKPRPDYTKEARQNRTEGTVTLKCLLSSSGKVTNVMVVQGLPDGLTEEAIKAARKIKFQPAMKDGRVVSLWVQINYEFEL